MMTRDKVSQNQPMQDWTEKLEWRSDADALNAWTNGQTGFDIIDAAMIQLRELGWMHNRLRMVTAMFLTKNLMVDWRLGELHFSKHLIDYDFASNNGGWQWAASTGTDAAPYFRIFNPESQAEKFDPDRQYQAQWLNGHSRPTQIVDLKTTRAFSIQAFKSAKAGATESDN
jgi:deoxyribodipyrimidine photo-lyase